MSDDDEPFDEPRFRFVHHDFGLTFLEQLRHSVDFHAGKSAADVIRMGVGHKRVRDFHLVLLRDLEDRIDLPRRVDHCGFARLLRADEIDVVLHRADFDCLK